MVFLAVVVLGIVGLNRMSVELLPTIAGDTIWVSFFRQGSTPEVIERDILIPLESRVRGLRGVSQTTGQIHGNSGSLTVTFHPGTNIKIREYEIQRIASLMTREQDRRSTQINVNRASTESFTGFVMSVQVLGGNRDLDVLFDLAEREIVPRLAAIPGISRAEASGGGGRRVIITVDQTKAADLGASADQVVSAISRKLGETRWVGTIENEDGRISVIFDGKTDSLGTLLQTRINQSSPLTIGHVAEMKIGYGRSQRLYRIDGMAAVGITLFQEQGAKLMDVGRATRKRIEELEPLAQSLGIELRVGFDASEDMGEQIQNLVNLCLTGFGIALLVLFVFLRQWRAVAIVGIAVPVSLTAALSALYLLGYTLNLITLFGLALSVGMLVDNSIVVYEAILRGIERGVPPAEAARRGLKKTVRAIVAASLTTAAVFLVIFLVEFDSAAALQIFELVAVSLVLPLFSSLVVAIGLVPLLAFKLAAPAAEKRVQRNNIKRAARAGLVVPDRGRLLLAGLVTRALRGPAAWIAGTILVVIVSLVLALPRAALNQAPVDAPGADSIQFLTTVSDESDSDVEILATLVSRIEERVLGVEGVETVETTVIEGEANFNITFVEQESRPEDFSPRRVRDAAQAAVAENERLQMWADGERPYEGNYGSQNLSSYFGGSAGQQVIVTGPDPRVLTQLADDIVGRLRMQPHVQNATKAISTGRRELWVEAKQSGLEAFGVNISQVLPFLRLASSTGETLAADFVLSTGHEIPVVVLREGAEDDQVSRRELARLRINTPNGVIPISAIANMREMPAPPTIVHKNGRREMTLSYSTRDFGREASYRESVQNEVKEYIRSMPRPEGYFVEIPDQDAEQQQLIEKITIPLLLLMFLVLAVTLESLTLPILIMIVAIPLSIVGSLWGLVITGTPLTDIMTIVGFVALIGLVVNPAILLIDRMQQLVRVGYTSGGAAYAAVKERTRPVLMTTATTVAAMWPLAMQTGAENELWPPFAVVVMSGLISSALLVLIILPILYVLLRKLDELFGRVGAWLAVGWLIGVISIMSTLIMVVGLSSLFWQIVCGVLVGAVLLWICVMLFRRTHLPEPDCSNGPPELEVTYLSKIYGLAGPIRSTLNSHKEFALKVVRSGGEVFLRGDALERCMVFFLLAVGAGALGWFMPAFGWSLIYWLVATAFLARVLLEFRKFRGLFTDDGRAKRGGIEGFMVVLLPWIAILGFSYYYWWLPRVNEEDTSMTLFWPILLAILVAIGQLVRRSAVRQGHGDIEARISRGFMRYPRNWWRRFCRRIGGLDLPAEEIRALWNVQFTAKQGMIGILGPNGAGKTTLLRQLAGIINPTFGAIKIGGVQLRSIQKYLARWVGYLPQDSGLPLGLSPREYLQYYAALYDLPPDIRNERVSDLLKEVGLADKINDKIGSLSGGMKQRVAVARTLLRLPAIIIVDEPTVGLDPQERIRFRNLLARLAESRIVLFSTHVVEDVAISCERVLVVAKSQLRFDGSPSELANYAVDKVWERRVEVDGDKSLPEGAILAEETPTPDGATVQRVIWGEPPALKVRSLNARPEDGYLWLLSTT